MRKETKSSKIRWFHANGVKVGKIAELVNVDAHFVSCVLTRDRKRKHYNEVSRLAELRRRRAAGVRPIDEMRSQNAARNRSVIADVKRGMTYNETAKVHGISRCAVAGICDRAGVQVGMRPQSRAAMTGRPPAPK